MKPGFSDLRVALRSGNGLGKRLLATLVLISALVTATITAGEFYLRYRSELRKIEVGFSFISDIYQPALAESVWSLDEKQIATQLEGLLRLPNVRFLSVNLQGKERWSAGVRSARTEIVRKVPLTYARRGTSQVIGELLVVASDDAIIDTLWSELALTLAGNALKTLIVVLFMLVIFQGMVTRHLAHLGHYLRLFAHEPSTEPLVFTRAASGRWRPDVLDEVMNSVNVMSASLQREKLASRTLTAQLAKSEAMFRTIFRQAGAAITVVECETMQVAEVNGEACEVLGYSRQELLGAHLADYQIDLSEDHVRTLLPAIETASGMRMFGRHRRKDGRVLDVDESLGIVVVDGQRFLVNVWRDVSQQKSIERELATTRDELRLMAASVPVAVFRYQRVGGVTPKFIYVSPPMEHLTGASAAQIIADAEAFFSRIHPQDRAAVVAADVEATNSLSPFNFTCRVIPREGEVRWINCVSEPRHEAVHGMVWYGYIQDVTEQQLTSEQMRVAQERFHVAFAASPLSVSIARAHDGRFIIVNGNFTRDFGWSEDELVGHLATETVWANIAQRQGVLERLRNESRLVDFETHLRRKDGSLCPVSLSAELTKIDGEACVLAFISDISERMRGRESERRAASVFTHSIEGIVVMDGENHIVDANPAFSTVTGYPREAVLGKPVGMFASERHAPGFYAEMRRKLRETDLWRGELWSQRQNGEAFPAIVSVAAVRNDAGVVSEYIAVFSDISTMKAHQEELQRIAYFDALTGLPNRRLLGDRLQLALSRARRERTMLALCFVDLDGFKPINDQFGHAAGDQFLRAMAHNLGVTLRGGDTLARFGGDEFVLLFGDVGSRIECEIVLQRVLELVQKPVALDTGVVSVSASIGVTLFPHDDSDADALLRHADQAMYRAKELGKNQFHFFDAEKDRRLSARRESVQALERAFERHEFVLFYQPKIDLRTGAVMGAEALIRWRQSDGTIVPPGNFLPDMDGEPLEILVSEWVIKTALEQLVQFRAAGLTIQISANLVAAHLGKPDFISWLRALLATDPHYRRFDLSLEILESAAIGEVDVVARQLDAVRAMGIEVALDDFGTGYSSLAYFRRLPVDVLKIDQGFVRDMLIDTSDHAIVESVIRLAEVFKRRAIAEGVETMAHWKDLLALGCHYGQGYGIARPMPAENVMPWVKQWRENGEWKKFLTAAPDTTAGQESSR